jgi:hypothetical protein
MSACRIDAQESASGPQYLDRQQARVLANGEHADLVALIERHQALLLRKAQALREWVRRGLRMRRCVTVRREIEKGGRTVAYEGSRVSDPRQPGWNGDSAT